MMDHAEHRWSDKYVDNTASLIIQMCLDCGDVEILGSVVKDLAMTEYGKALFNTLAMERSAMLNDGLKPVAVKLTSPEIRELRDSLTLGPPTESNRGGMKIFGLAILEVNEPIKLAERFVCDD